MRRRDKHIFKIGRIWQTHAVRTYKIRRKTNLIERPNTCWIDLAYKHIPQDIEHHYRHSSIVFIIFYSMSIQDIAKRTLIVKTSKVTNDLFSCIYRYAYICLLM